MNFILKLMNSYKNTKISAIIFDFDGVIVNSEPLWFKAAILSLKEINIKYDNQITFKQTIGMVSENVWKLLIKEKIQNHQKRKLNTIYKKNLDLLFLKKLKLSRGFKFFIRHNNLPSIIVSNASSRYIFETLNRLKIDQFSKKDIISCTGQLLPKPKPDGYIKAINQLKLPIKNLLVIEDSDVGISAAKSAGIKNIIRHTHNNENLPKKIKHKIPILKSFMELNKFIKKN